MDKMNQEHLDELNFEQVEESEQKGLNKPYDSAFKSIIQKCPRLALFLINEMFYQRGLISKKYDGTEQVRLLNGELSDVLDKNLEEDIRMMVESEESGNFHLECESAPGNAYVMLRVVRYHVRTALNNMKLVNGHIKVRINDSGVLFLRSTENTPEKVIVSIEGPQESSMSYEIPALMLKSYTEEILMEKELYILLPFLFFNYEKDLKNVKDPESYKTLNTRWGKIIDHLKEKTADGSINAYEEQTLYDALKVVVEALAQKNKVTEEVKEIMGGRVLEFRADNVFNAGKNEGRKEGRKEGFEEGRKEERKVWQEKDKEWQEKDKEWQEKDKEWQMERQKMQMEIEKLRMQMKATNAMPGLAT